MENKMTPTPWTAPHLSNIIGANGKIIFEPTLSYFDIQKANASAIVSAINCTYGAGINPEAVTDLLSALEKLRGIEAWITDRKMKEFFQNTVYRAIEKVSIK